MLTRREMLHRVGTGLGVLGLASVLDQQQSLGQATPRATNPLAPKPGHMTTKPGRFWFSEPSP